MWNFDRVSAAAAMVMLGGCAVAHSGAQCETAADCARGSYCIDAMCVLDVPPDDAGSPTTDAAGAWPATPSDGGHDGAVPCGEVAFVLTDTQESFVVPSGVRYMHVKAWGAGGNDERQCGAVPDGGPGGFSEAVFEAVPGTELVVIVGRRGRAGVTGEDLVRFGFGAWGGGGLTGVFRGPGPIAAEDCDRALVIAGGGGSASAPGCSPGIPGNHPEAGGMGTMQGQLPPSGSPVGGGGGCNGGRAGASGRASGGGSGFVSTDALDARILHAEPGSDAPPRTDDPDYDGAAGRSEASGRLVIRYSCEPPPALI